MHRTGLTAEQMSGLGFAAKATGVEYDSLLSGLVKFEAGIVKAAGGTGPQAEAFRRLGISQADIQAGKRICFPC